MGWDGLYVGQRVYPKFNIGDEVTPIKNYKVLTKGKGYIILNIESRFSHIKENDGWLITLKTDIGFEAKYASYNFKKSKRQLKQDKLNKVLENLLENEK